MNGYRTDVDGDIDQSLLKAQFVKGFLDDVAVFAEEKPGRDVHLPARGVVLHDDVKIVVFLALSRDDGAGRSGLRGPDGLADEGAFSPLNKSNLSFDVVVISDCSASASRIGWDQPNASMSCVLEIDLDTKSIKRAFFAFYLNG